MLAGYKDIVIYSTLYLKIRLQLRLHLHLAGAEEAQRV